MIWAGISGFPLLILVFLYTKINKWRFGDKMPKIIFEDRYSWDATAYFDAFENEIHINKNIKNRRYINDVLRHELGHKYNSWYESFLLDWDYKRSGTYVLNNHRRELKVVDEVLFVLHNASPIRIKPFGVVWRIIIIYTITGMVLVLL